MERSTVIDVFYGAIFGSLLGTISWKVWIFPTLAFFVFFIIWLLPILQPHIYDIPNYNARIVLFVVVFFVGITVAFILFNYLFVQSTIIETSQMKSILIMLTLWTIIKTYIVIPRGFFSRQMP